MPVRFAPDARALIDAANALAQSREQESPRVRDLTDALAQIGVPLPPFAIAALNDSVEQLIAFAAERSSEGELSVDALVDALAHYQRDAVSSGAADPDSEDVDDAHTRSIALTRTGIGYDSHRFAPGGPMILGGVRIDADMHCDGHSDGDAICHALTDALLGAAAAGDIGEMFPDTDAANKGRDSIEMLRAAYARIRSMRYALVNADITVVAEKPKIGPHRMAIRETLAAALGVEIDAISVKGKTNERMGWIGRGEGLGVMAVATIARFIE